MIRILVHAAILALVNLGAIVAGFALYVVLGRRDQIAVQVPAAVLLSIGLFTAWLALARRFAPRALGIAGARDGWRVYLLAPAVAVAAFVPLHYLTQGYVTSAGNVVALCGFMLIVNGVAVPLGFLWGRAR